MKTLFALVAVCVVGVWAKPADTEHPYERTALGDAIDKASLKMLKDVYESGSDKNVITSPLGLMILLALYGQGASAGAQEQIRKFLGAADQREVTKSFSELSDGFAKMDPRILTLANKVCVSRNHTLADKFKETAATYQTSFDSLDFSKPQEAADYINRWASEKTNGNIKDAVSAQILTPDTISVLINVIFFQGHWNVPFKANETQDDDFHVDKTTTVKKPTMHLTRPLYFKENRELNARMVELPYKETGFRMVILLPDDVDGLPKVLEKVAKTGLLDDLYSSFGININLSLPKFETRNKLDLRDILGKLGVSKIFSEPAAGIVKDTSVVVSKAIQDAFIKVNEEGAEAGAVTVITNLGGVLGQDFKANHPFLYSILYKDKTLFVGTLSH